MEQKKTLWIIAAVGVFLLVVVGAALILYSPSLHNSNEIAVHTKTEKENSPADKWMTPSTPAPAVSVLPDTSQPASPDGAAPDAVNPPLPGIAPDASAVAVPNGAENVLSSAQNGTAPQQNNASQMNSQPIQSDNVTVIAKNTTVYGTGTTTIDLNTLKTVTPSYSESQTTSQNVAPQNQAAAEAMNTVSEKQYSYSNPAPVKSEQAKSVAKETTSVKQTSSSKSTAKTSSSVAAKKTAAKAETKVPDRWWVQAASYTAKKNADEARAVLEDNKIPSEVFTWKNKDKLYYRVRVGPYTTKSEAEYWQSRIKYIDQFAKVDSYVVNSSAKAVN